MSVAFNFVFAEMNIVFAPKDPIMLCLQYVAFACTIGPNNFVFAEMYIVFAP